MTWRRQLVELPSTARAVGWRLRRVLPAVIAALGGAVLLTGVYMGHGFITTSERFAISAIEVRGNRMLSTTQVESLAAISAGQNIFRTELGALATRLERNP
ncbi:MAG: FtsQ-type POTRA domain-containing protein, partial [Myxococcota bacterium]